MCRPFARAAATPSLDRSQIRSRSTSANSPNRAILTLVWRCSNLVATLECVQGGAGPIDRNGQEGLVSSHAASDQVSVMAGSRW